MHGWSVHKEDIGHPGGWIYTVCAGSAGDELGVADERSETKQAGAMPIRRTEWRALVRVGAVGYDMIHPGEVKISGHSAFITVFLFRLRVLLMDGVRRKKEHASEDFAD